MTIEDTKFWFVGYSASPKRIFYLFQADNMVSASERLKDFKGVAGVYMVTWDKLNKLIGAVRPDNANFNNAARGLLSFRYKDCDVYIVK